MDFGRGEFGHYGHAPLSGDQTVHIADLLKEELRAASVRIDSLERAVERNAKHADDNSHSHADNTRLITSLQDDLHQSSATVKMMLEEQLKTKKGMDMLQSNHEQAVQEAAELRSDQLRAAENLQRHSHELSRAASADSAMREVIEKRVFVDIDRLRDGLKKTRADVGALQTQGEDLKATARAHQEGLRLASERMDALQNGTDRLRQVCNELETATTKAEQTLQNTRQRLGQTNTTVHNLFQDSGSTRATLEALGADHGKLRGLLQNALQELEKATSRLQALDIRFTAKCSNIDSNTQNVQECGRQLQNLKAWSDHSKEIQMSLQVQGQELQGGLRQTQQTLEETNAMVLPNLGNATPSSARCVNLAKAQRRKPVPSLALRASSISTMADSVDPVGGWF